MTLEILTPEHKIFNGEVRAVQLPGKEGLFQILEGHAALISSLSAGEVKIELSQARPKDAPLHPLLKAAPQSDHLLHLHIEGGVVEVNQQKVILLAS